MLIEEEEKSNVGLIIFIILVFVIVVGLIIAIIFLKEPIKNIFKEEEEPIKEFDIVVVDYDTKEKIQSNYILNQGVIKVQEGIVRPNILEKYKGKENVSYELIAWSNKYHQSKTNCSLKKAECRLELKKIPDLNIKIPHIEDDEYLFILKIDDGYLINPLICLKWDYLILDINIKDLNKTEIPPELKTFYDACYRLNNQTTNQYLIYQLMLEQNSYNDEETTFFELMVRDECQQPIGCLGDINKRVEIDRKN